MILNEGENERTSERELCYFVCLFILLQQKKWGEEKKCVVCSGIQVALKSRIVKDSDFNKASTKSQSKSGGSSSSSNQCFEKRGIYLLLKFYLTIRIMFPSLT